MRTCARDGVTTVSANAKNICGGGGDSSVAYMCNDQQPYVENNVMHAFVASNSGCCECFDLEFTSTAVSGSHMIIQVTNSGDDLGAKHFDIQMTG